MEKVDFKKSDKVFYLPKRTPSIVDLPRMTFMMVDGQGDPNTSEAYAEALKCLYALSYAIKMSPRQGLVVEGYFDYVVPPLEGFWWLSNDAIPFADGQPMNKANFNWTAMIRQPDFVTQAVFEEAQTLVRHKQADLDLSGIVLKDLTEGLCAQVMHLGSYDSESETIQGLDDFILASGHEPDFTETRHHHEIYLNDPRKVAADKLKTIIRHPIKPS